MSGREATWSVEARARQSRISSELLRGRPVSVDTRQKIAAAQAGEKGYQWRGEDVGYSGIHKRARAVLPEECSDADETCKGRFEVALRPDASGPFREDKRGIYSPRLEDYRMLCRSHHNREHGRVPPWRKD